MFGYYLLTFYWSFDAMPLLGITGGLCVMIAFVLVCVAIFICIIYLVFYFCRLIWINNADVPDCTPATESKEKEGQSSVAEDEEWQTCSSYQAEWQDIKPVVVLPPSINRPSSVKLALMTTVAEDYQEIAFSYGLSVPLFFLCVNQGVDEDAANYEYNYWRDVNLWRISFFHNQASCFCKIHIQDKDIDYPQSFTVIEDSAWFVFNNGITETKYLFRFDLQGKFLNKIIMADPDQLEKNKEENDADRFPAHTFAVADFKGNHCVLMGWAEAIRSGKPEWLALSEVVSHRVSKYEIDFESCTARCFSSASEMAYDTSHHCYWPLPDGFVIDFDPGDMVIEEFVNRWLLYDYKTGALNFSSYEEALETFHKKIINGDRARRGFFGIGCKQWERSFKKLGNRVVPLDLRVTYNFGDEPDDEGEYQFRPEENKEGRGAVFSLDTIALPKSLKSLEVGKVLEKLLAQDKKPSEDEMKKLGIPEEIIQRLDEEREWENEEPIILEVP